MLPEILAHAACALGALSDFVSAKRLLAEATDRAAEDESRLRVVRYASAKVAFWAGEAGAVVDLLGEAVLPADPRLRMEMLLILAMSMVMVDGRDAFTRGLDLVLRAEALVGHSADGSPVSEALRDDPVARVQCAKARVACCYFSGEYAKGASAAEAAVEIARRAGLRFDECAHLHNAGEQHLRGGERDRARVALLASNEIARDIGAERSTQHNDVLLAYLDASSERLDHIADAARAASDSWQELHARYWLGHLFAAAGAPLARPTLDRALVLAGQLKVRTMADECTRALKNLPAVDDPN